MLKLHKKDMGPTKRMLGYTSMMEEIIAMFLEEFGKPDSIEPLMKINDPVLGELTVGAFLSRVYSVDFYGKQQKVALVVQLFDGLEITENQRKTFIGFESNKSKILKNVEQAILDYYISIFKESKDFVENDLEVSEKVILTKIKIMYSEAGESQVIGFILSASFDPELGIGVVVSNGVVTDVDVQDIVLG